jgi:hypothetical protein
MDEFEKRLKRDADAIQAEASPELRARIDASLRSTSQVRPAGRKTEPAPANMWWASSLTGLAAAIMVIVLINWNRADSVPVPAENIAKGPSKRQKRPRFHILNRFCPAPGPVRTARRQFHW